MTKHIFNFLLAAFLTYSLTSCDRPECENTNPIFNQYEAGDQAYQEELIDVMEGQELRYWLKAYEKEADAEYLWLYVQNETICALAKMRVGERAGIEGLLAAKGVSYRGAELVGVEYQISNDNELVFKGLDHMLD